MTNKQERQKEDGRKEVSVPFDALKDMPDFAKDPIEKIETWIKNVLPEELQEVVIEKIKEERSKESAE